MCLPVPKNNSCNAFTVINLLQLLCQLPFSSETVLSNGTFYLFLLSICLHYLHCKRIGSTHFTSCPILSHRVHPTKRSICCRSKKFHLISEKWTKCCRFDRFVRFVKWKSLLSIRQVRSTIGQLHRSENCISLARSGQSAVDSIDSFDLSNGKVSYRFDKCGR